MALHCPECGFVNPEGANYCQKCGAYLGRPEGADEPTTMTYKVDETGEYTPIDIDEEVGKAGAALVLLAQAVDELGAQDVDLPVQDPALVGDVDLLLRELLDELLELLVGERAEVGERVHGGEHTSESLTLKLRLRVPEPPGRGLPAAGSS